MMLAEVVQTVHTSGVNWASVLTIVCSLVAALGIIFGAIAKYVTSSLTRSTAEAIQRFQLSVVSTLATRLSVLETKVDLLLNTKNRDKSNDRPYHA
jgi:hypothetical protein